MTGNPEVISSPVGLVPRNALAVTIAFLARSRLSVTNPAKSLEPCFGYEDERTVQLNGTTHAVDAAAR